MAGSESRGDQARDGGEGERQSPAAGLFPGDRCRYCSLGRRVFQPGPGIPDIPQPPFGVLLQAAPQQTPDLHRNPLPPRFPGGDFDEGVGDRFPREKPIAREHLEQDDAEGPNVRALIHQLPTRLFGRHVGSGTDNHAHPADRVHRQALRVLEPLAGRGFVRHLGQSEIQHLHRAVRPQDDVARLQIAVHDALLVRVFERVGDLPGDLQRLIQGHGALPDSFRQCGTVHQLHHQVIGSDVVKVADVGMIQRGHRRALRGRSDR